MRSQALRLRKYWVSITRSPLKLAAIGNLTLKDSEVRSQGSTPKEVLVFSAGFRRLLPRWRGRRSWPGGQIHRVVQRQGPARQPVRELARPAAGPWRKSEASPSPARSPLPRVVH